MCIYVTPPGIVIVIACNIHGSVGWNAPKWYCVFLLNSDTISCTSVLCYIAMENVPFNSMIYHNVPAQLGEFRVFSVAM